MNWILPDDGPEVDPQDRPPGQWDYESVVPGDWCWNDEGVEAFKLQIGWGPR